MILEENDRNGRNQVSAARRGDLRVLYWTIYQQPVFCIELMNHLFSRLVRSMFHKNNTLLGISVLRYFVSRKAILILRYV